MKKNYKRLSLLLSVLVLSCGNSFSQDTLAVDTTAYVDEETYERTEPAFESTRIINGHSVETLRKGVLEFRVEHHFGDLAGSKGGFYNWFGIDDAADIRLALEYGITDNWMIGAGRSKGAGQPYRSLLDGFTKYRLLRQSKQMPVSLSALGTMAFSYQRHSSDIYSVSNFPKFIYRFAYSAQLNVTRRFGSLLSLALMPTVVHRNYVANDDQNTIFALGGAMRWSLTQKLGFIVEYYQTMTESNIRSTNFNSLAVAVEWMTFGHNFTIYLTNARGFGETQFITNTYDNWLKGQFRIGFCIGRKFDLIN